MVAGPDGGSPDYRGNAVPIVYEIRHALERLVATGESSTIDLNGIPFGPGDEERLVALLGTGEVEATVDALGPTRIRETAIPGVWLIDPRSTEAGRLALHSEVTTAPDLLRTQTPDLARAVAELDARLDLNHNFTRPQS